ncbi:LuxR C-terminal-related transcriptional regulator [Streptomyces sp. OfavH-34-F]|uniref:LuxR C-terminal-related transcriptional regulator n=1 Tax=unclassified Streptomyces TaxID=2593676 RepID=UPI001EF22D3E|nr:LuxR C-terminal-related transcriptional regulator [Streptomyces sp. OfavH-34-F]MCG7523704.1 LuxR C-terminal-related transcriptional regulator [Streptomyces sp. OfavH-34-F]
MEHKVPDGPSDVQQLMSEHLEALSRLVADSPAAAPEAPAVPDPLIRHHHGLDAINAAIDEALAGAREEILTAQPDGPRPGPVLDQALESVRRRLAGGVAMRTLYQHTTRFDEATKNYVRTVSDYGARVRTLDEFHDRLIIIDESVAFVSANENRTHAVAIREPAVVRFLKGTFERSWDRANPFPFLSTNAAKAAEQVIPSLRKAIRKLLVAGYPDKQIARRLGISERSLQGHIAAMKQDLGAHTRIQLGYELGRNETTLIV